MNSFLKYFFVVINLLFVVFGALCTGFALWSRAIQLIDATLTVVELNFIFFYFGIFLGVLLILIGLCGTFGACYEKKGILFFYLTIILVFLLCEVGILVFAIVKGTEEINKKLEETWTTLLSNETKEAVQETFKCCGYNNASEWINDPPSSCYPNMTKTNETETFEKSCRQSVLDWFSSNIFVFGGALAATLLFQLAQMAITALLIRSINLPNRVESGNNSRPNPAVRTRAPPSTNRNASYSNASFAQDSFHDDTRGRNMKVKKQQKPTQVESNW